MNEKRKIIERQDSRANLNNVIREKFLGFDTDSDHLVYSKDGSGFIDFMNKTEVQAISASLQNNIFTTQNSLSGYLPTSASSFSGNLSANSFIKNGGTSTQFLKADGSVDSNSYLPLSGGTLTGTLTLLSGQNGLVSTNTVNQLSAASIRINNVSAGNGIIVNNTGSSGCGIYIQQMSTNPNSVGLFVYSNSSAPGIMVDGKISATQYFVQNGLSTQFLKANGTVDSTQYLPLSGGTLTGQLNGTNLRMVGDISATGNLSWKSGTIIDYPTYPAYSMLYPSGVTVSAQNYIIGWDKTGLYTFVNAISSIFFSIQNVERFKITDSGVFVTGNIVKTGGTSTQFLKADGSVDSNPYSYKYSTCAFVSAIGGDVPLSIVSATIPAQTLNTRTVKVSFNYDILNTGSHTSYIQVIFGGDTTTLPTGTNGNCNGKVELLFTASTTGSSGKVSRAASNFGYHGVGVFTAILNNFGGEMSTVNLDQDQGLQVKMLDNASGSTMRVHQVLIEIL